MHNLDGEVSAMFLGGWNGSAAAASDHGGGGWRAGADEVMDGLQTSARLLRASAEAYAKQGAAAPDAFVVDLAVPNSTPRGPGCPARTTAR